MTSKGKLRFNFIYSLCSLNLVLETYESKKNVEFDNIPNNPHEKYPKSKPANVDFKDNIKESVAKRLRRKNKDKNHENETPRLTNLESNIDLAETSLQLTTTKSIIDETSSKRESKTHEERIQDYQEPNLISFEK